MFLSYISLYFLYGAAYAYVLALVAKGRINPFFACYVWPLRMLYDIACLLKFGAERFMNSNLFMMSSRNITDNSPLPVANTELEKYGGYRMTRI